LFGLTSFFGLIGVAVAIEAFHGQRGKGSGSSAIARAALFLVVAALAGAVAALVVYGAFHRQYWADGIGQTNLQASGLARPDSAVAIDRVVVTGGVARIEGRGSPDARLIFKVAGEDEESCGFLNNDAFVATVGTHWGRLVISVKDAEGNVLLTQNQTDFGSAKFSDGEIFFHDGEVAQQPDGSYVVAQFVPANGGALPISVSMGKQSPQLVRRSDQMQLFYEQPPVVVETHPVSGAVDVPAGETEVRVRFSKKMTGHSWSWVTAWDNSPPKMAGAPGYLEDERTCVVKVRLEPGKIYGWWLNSDNFKNFTDQGGLAAVPYLLVFQTKQN
jgi:hypothetical protein